MTKQNSVGRSTPETRLAIGPKILKLDQGKGIEILASIAHDMRTPLATIAASAELLEQNFEVEDGHFLVEIIHRQVDRLQHMIYELGELAGVSPAGRKREESVCDLAELLRDVVAQFQHLGTGHRLMLDVPAGVVPASVNGEQVTRIVQNLLSNAVQYSPSGTSIHVRLRLPSEDGTEVMLEVEDDGPGIPEWAKEEIFKPFVRLDRTRGTGSGLGLDIVRRFAQLQGGRVWVESGSVGALFKVSLPVMEAEQSFTSIGSASADEGGGRAGKQDDVLRQRPLSDIRDIQSDHLDEAKVAPPTHLPKSR